MKKYLFAVDFGNAGSRFFECLAESQKEGHVKVWDNLNDGTMKQSNVECIEMIDVIDTGEIPSRHWVNTVNSVDDRDVVGWGKL